MQHNGWDHALKVTTDGKGLVCNAGAVLLRKAADQLGLTAGLSAALLVKGSSPLLDPGDGARLPCSWRGEEWCCFLLVPRVQAVQTRRRWLAGSRKP